LTTIVKHSRQAGPIPSLHLPFPSTSIAIPVTLPVKAFTIRIKSVESRSKSVQEEINQKKNRRSRNSGDVLYNDRKKNTLSWQYYDIILSP